MDLETARALQTSCRRFQLADQYLREAEGDAAVVNEAENYLAARTAHQEQIEKAEVSP